MKFSATNLLFALVVATCMSSCSYIMPRTTCEQWKAEGKIYSTIDSCARCVQSLGGSNVEAVAGCAVGMDAATLLDASRPKP